MTQVEVLTPLQEAARIRNAKDAAKRAQFKEPSSSPSQPLRGEPSRMQLREADERVKEARASLDAAKRALDAKRKEWFAKISAVDEARGVTTGEPDDHDAAGRQARRNEARQHLEDAEAAHEQWLVDKELGKTVGKEPPSVAELQAKIDRAEAERDTARNTMKLFEAEIGQREYHLSLAKRKRSEAQGEILQPKLEQLVTRYEAAIDEAIRLRQRIFVMRDAIPGATIKLSGLEKAVSDCTTDTRNALAKLSVDADASLDCILKPHRANGAAT